MRVRASSQVQVQPRFAALEPLASAPWDMLAESLHYVACASFQPAVEFAMPSPYVPRLVGTAVDHIGHSSPIDVGVAGHQCPQRYGAKVVGPYRRQGTTVAAEGGADGVTDKSLIHASHVVCLSGLYRQANEVFQLGVFKPFDLVNEPEARRCALQRRQIGIDALDTADTGQRISTGLNHLAPPLLTSLGPS